MTTQDTGGQLKPEHKLANTIIYAPRSEVLRWRSMPDAVIEGEAIALLKASNVRVTQDRITATSQFMKMYADNFDYYVFNGRVLPGLRTGVGVVLHQRVRGLSNENREAAQYLKIWNMASLDDFARVHLPKLVRYAAASQFPLQISIPNLISCLLNWESNKGRIIQTISEEYFAQEHNANNQEGNK